MSTNQTAALICRIDDAFYAKLLVHPDTDTTTGTAVLTWNGPSGEYLEIKAAGDHAEVRADLPIPLARGFLAGAFESRTAWTIELDPESNVTYPRTRRNRCFIFTTPDRDGEDFACTTAAADAPMVLHLVGLPVDDLTNGLLGLELAMLAAPTAA